MDIKTILNFRPKNKEALENIKDLTLIVKKFIKENILFQSLIEKLSQTLSIPKSIIEKRSYQIIFKNYNIEKKKFIFKNSFLNISRDFFIVLSITLFLTFSFFIKRKKVIKKFDLICDGLSSNTDIFRHKLLSKNFHSTLLLSNKKLDLDNENTKILFTKSEFLNLTSINLSFKRRLFLILISFKIFLDSITHNFNFLSIFKDIIYDFIKYKKIYSQYSAKYYFNYKFYDTNPLQNYLFKVAGGIKTSCFQKSLCTLPLSCFVYSDIFFSLGKEQGKICNNLGGEIEQFKPVGSFFIESTWLKQKKDLEKIPDIDVLIIGLNVPWQYSPITEDFNTSYYKKFLPWVKKISEDFPTKKIYYKHHSNFSGDVREKNLLSGTNIKIIRDNMSINSTYAWAFKSKINLSFGSTMVLELNGNGKEAYFIDPDGRNYQWYYGIRNLEKYRIKTYETLKKIIENNDNKKNKLNFENNDFLCIKSDNTSKNIANFLKNCD